MNRSRFQRGSGCFTCSLCGKQTRNTGDNGSCHLCPLCYAKSLCGNSFSDSGRCPPDRDPWATFDGCQSEAECEALLSRLLGEGAQ